MRWARQCCTRLFGRPLMAAVPSPFGFGVLLMASPLGGTTSGLMSSSSFWTILFSRRPTQQLYKHRKDCFALCSHQRNCACLHLSPGPSILQLSKPSRQSGVLCPALRSKSWSHGHMCLPPEASIFRLRRFTRQSRTSRCAIRRGPQGHRHAERIPALLHPTTSTTSCSKQV